MTNCNNHVELLNRRLKEFLKFNISKDLFSLVETLVCEFIPRNTREYFYSMAKTTKENRQPINKDSSSKWLLERPGLIQRLMNNAKISGMRQAKEYHIHKLTDSELTRVGLSGERAYAVTSPYGDHYIVAWDRGVCECLAFVSTGSCFPCKHF